MRKKTSQVWWSIAAVAILTLLFYAMLRPVVEAGVITERRHYQATGAQWPLTERWILVLRTDYGSDVLVDVTREQWEAAQAGQRWPK